MAVTGTALVAAAALAPAPSERPGRALAWLLFVGSSVHVASTGWFATSPDVRSHATTGDRRLLALPVVCVVLGCVAAAMLSGRGMTWLLLLLFAWQFHHFQKQNLGVAAMAARAAGVEAPRRLERRAVVLAGLCGIAALVADPGLLQIEPYAPVRAALLALGAVALVTVVAGALLLLARPRGRRAPSYCAAYLMALVFPLPIFIFRSPDAAVGGMTIGHGLQYLVLMGLVARGRAGTDRRRRDGAVLCAIALVGGAALNVASHLHLSSSAAVRALFGLYVGLVATHFVVDARLWRLSRPFPRAFLGARLPFITSLPDDTRLPIDRIPI